MKNMKNFILKNRGLSITTFIMTVIIIVLAAGLISVQGKQSKEVMGYQRQIEDFETSIMALNDEKSSLENENAKLSSKVAEYEENAAKFDAQITELSEYRDTYKELEEKYNSLKVDYDKISAENASLKEKSQSTASTSANTASNTASNTSAQSAATSSGGNSGTSATSDKSYTVYITNTGNKYHSSGCRYLKKSKISISKDSAISKGYSACSVCNP